MIILSLDMQYGLIPVGNTKMEAKEYVGDAENYVIKNSWTFLDGFLNILTWGIYTPTTTTFYVPVNEMGK